MERRTSIAEESCAECHDRCRASEPGWFSSGSLAAHMLRGLIAAALITWALLHQVPNPALAVAAGVGAVVAMRGCPLCWTLGLWETIAKGPGPDRLLKPDTRLDVRRW